jgi:hypothetical protein
MKSFIKFYISTFSIVLLISCSKDCAPSNSSICAETAPTNEMCLAYFQRWFYNPESNQCEQISYSGCSQRGFATENECNECICHGK